jgi:aminodeoxyfutalosine deaminase
VLIRARTVLPGDGPPLNDGALWIQAGRIIRTGPWKDLRRVCDEPAEDLGDALILPGLINAHCHFEYTRMAGILQPPKAFPDWIKALSSARRTGTAEERAGAWAEGTRQALASGSTTVVNIETSPAPTPLPAVRPRVVSLFETSCLGLRRSAGEALDEAIQTVRAAEAGGALAGLSPHSPYATTGPLLAGAAQAALRHSWMLSTHIAESQAEFDMFMFRRGPMFDWLSTQRAMDDCGHGSPVRHCEESGLFAAPCLAAHVNYLWKDDASRLARNRVAVVHCPRSHGFFRHQRFPLETLREAGVPVCLGTDSLASTRTRGGETPTLSMFDEMRAFADLDALTGPAEILAMATTAAAARLGLEGVTGTLAEGSRADLVVVDDATATDPFEHVVHGAGAVRAVMIDGAWKLGINAAAGDE